MTHISLITHKDFPDTANTSELLRIFYLEEDVERPGIVGRPPPQATHLTDLPARGPLRKRSDAMKEFADYFLFNEQFESIDNAIDTDCAFPRGIEKM